jgi:hypothetical protein
VAESDGLTPAAARILLVIAALGLAVRIVVGLMLPNIIHQDETFQYLEQGHRLVYGTGLVPWEYVVGSRSWLFPGLIAGVIEIARIFGPSPETAATAVMIFISILSLAPVVCGFLWGWRIGGLPTAIAAGALNAVWFELVYFSGHTLSEALAADVLVVGLYLAYPGAPENRWRWLALGGVFLGLALIFRIQLGPAIAVGVIAICGTSFWRRWLPLLAGAAVPILLSGLLDALTWSWPFQSMALNLWINIGQGIAAGFSKSPLYQYLSLAVTYWSGAFVLIVALALVGARRLPVLLLVALTIYAAHTLLSHKEYRFTYPALPLITTLVGIGSAVAAQRLVGLNPDRRGRIGLLVGVPLFWAATSLILARGREFYPLWYRDRGSIEAMRIINRDPAACGVAIYSADLWDRNGGYAHLRGGMPLLALTDGDPDDRSGGFDYIISYKPADFTGRGFTRLACWQEPPGRTIAIDPICLWRRSGTCTSGAAPKLTATPPEFLAKAHSDWFSGK